MVISPGLVCVALEVLDGLLAYEAVATREYISLEECTIPFGAASARIAPSAALSTTLGIIATPAMTGIMMRHIIGTRMTRHPRHRRPMGVRALRHLKTFAAIGYGGQIAVSMSGLAPLALHQRRHKSTNRTSRNRPRASIP
jgi:hypothetical protein